MAKEQSKFEKLKSPIEVIGTWSFLIGFAISVVLALFNKTASNSTSLLWFLLILGTIIGFLNITTHEIIPFLIAGIALMLTGTVTSHIQLEWLKNIINNIVVFVLPGVIISSIKAILAIASTK